jgi:hypothetical protein
MFNTLISKIAAAFRKIDAIAERILGGLTRLYRALSQKLDGALDKLDQLTKKLLRRYYRALDYLERLF